MGTQVPDDEMKEVLRDVAKGAAFTPDGHVSLDQVARVLDTPVRVLDTHTRVLDTPPSVLDTPIAVLDTPISVLDTPTRVLDTWPRGRRSLRTGTSRSNRWSNVTEFGPKVIFFEAS